MLSECLLSDNTVPDVSKNVTCLQRIQSARTRYQYRPIKGNSFLVTRYSLSERNSGMNLLSEPDRECLHKGGGTW